LQPRSLFQSVKNGFPDPSPKTRVTSDFVSPARNAVPSVKPIKRCLYDTKKVALAPKIQKQRLCFLHFRMIDAGYAWLILFLYGRRYPVYIHHVDQDLHAIASLSIAGLIVTPLASPSAPARSGAVAGADGAGAGRAMGADGGAVS
jgi:hypothetical protein